MSTASFDRSFEVEDMDSAIRLHKDLQEPRKVEVAEKDYSAEEEKGILLLKQRFSDSQRR